MAIDAFDDRLAAESQTPASPPVDSKREETYTVALTAVAAVATAWSAFESAAWGATQAFLLARANHLHQKAMQGHLEGNQQRHFDAELFVAFAGAYVEHRDAFATFLHARFPERLKGPVDAWLATNPLTNPGAPPHPFEMPEYHVQALEQAAEDDRQADAISERAGDANRTGDRYVLATVVFAMIILIASLGARARGRNLRHVTLALSGAALVGAIVWLAWQPMAWVGTSSH